MVRRYKTRYNNVHKTCVNSVNYYFYMCYVNPKSRQFSNSVLVCRGQIIKMSVTAIVGCVYTLL